MSAVTETSVPNLPGVEGVCTDGVDFESAIVDAGHRMKTLGIVKCSAAANFQTYDLYRLGQKVGSVTNESAVFCNSTGCGRD